MASPSVALAQGEAFLLSSVMPDSYDLPHLSFLEQAVRLEDKGLIVSSQADAARWLERVGYYRLKPYWRTFELDDGTFAAGASLAHAVDLYLFDMRLRQCLLVGLEKFEVGLRVQISHSIGKRDALGHRQIQCLNSSKAFEHHNWLEKADAQLNECREEWLEEFNADFSGHVPTWMAVEAWSFALVSKLYGIMHLNDQAAIAKKFIVNRNTLASWARAAVGVRNSCAHHNRVWNKPLIDQPAIPKTWEAKNVQHLAEDRAHQTRVYSVFAILAHSLQVLGGAEPWKARVFALADSFPGQTGRSLNDAGFPQNWRDLALWS